MFVAFLFIDQSEHRKCEGVDIARGWMLNASHTSIPFIFHIIWYDIYFLIIRSIALCHRFYLLV